MSVLTPADPTTLRAPATRERRFTTLQSEITTAWSRLGVAAASARGRRHRANEDSYTPFAGGTPLFVVADGVGGGAMAAWASRKLVSVLHHELGRRHVDAPALRRALLAADRAIAQGIASRSAASGAATVAVCAATGLLRARWIVAWVGDCRVYQVDAQRRVRLLTRDDTYQNLGEDPPPGGSRDDPARMVGNGAVSAPNVDHAVLACDEMLVLVSDGVHKHVAPEAIARILRDNAPLARGCLRLVEAARGNGSEDDATALVVHRRLHPRLTILRRGAWMIALLVAAAVAAAAWDFASVGSTPRPLPVASQPERSS